MATIGSILIDGQNPSMPALRKWLQSLEGAVALAAQGISTVATSAARDAFYAIDTNRGKLVYVNNNNGSATDPANGVYEYVGGPRLAQSFYAGVASILQPLVDRAEAAATAATTGVAAITTNIRDKIIPAYVDRSNNLVLPRNIIPDVLISPNSNTFIGNSDWAVVKVPVTPGGKVTVSYKTYQGFFWEDAAGVRTGADAPPAPANIFPAGGYKITVPASAVLMYYSLEKRYLPNLQMIDGDVTLGHVFATTPSHLSDAHSWVGRTICLKSDSRAQEKAWPGAMGLAMGATILNLSRGGQGMGHALTYYVPAYIDASFNVVPVVDRPMVKADLANVSALLLSLTYNSAYQSGGIEGVPQPIGSFDDAVPEAGSGAAMPANFIPAMRYALRTYRVWNPAMWVGVVGTQHRYQNGGAAGDQIDAYQRQFRLIEQQVCLEESVPYLDFMTESGFNKSNIATDWPDAVHPTDLAHDRRTRRVIQGWMETKLPLA